MEPIILYEDNHIIVAVKPQNIPSQEDATGDLDMLSILKNYVRDKYSKPGGVFMGLVHRLDRPTGGVMVFAKTSKAAARLSEQLREGDFEKKYLAVCAGRLKEKKARLVHYLAKDEKNNTVRIAHVSSEGAKRAELDYIVLEEEKPLSLVEIKLITGRGHQARVQMTAAGASIYADVKYGAALGKGQNLALWAYSLRFIHPTTGLAMSFKVFPPEETPWTQFKVYKHINVVRPE